MLSDAVFHRISLPISTRLHMPARIFISHSAKADEQSQKFRDNLIARIKAESDAEGRPRFDVLCDRLRLEPGAEWRDEIYTWMGLCHASVILISQGALEESIWVPRECSILLYRRTLQPNFLTIPVLLPPVQRESLNVGHYKDLSLTELHEVPDGDESERLDNILKQLITVKTDRTHLEDMAEQLASELLNDRLSPDLARECCDRLCVNVGPWVSLRDPHRALALSLLQVPLGKAVQALREIPHAWRRLDKVLAMIEPSWVDLCAARHLAEIGLCSPPKPTLVLNANERWSAEMYVKRASFRTGDLAWRTVFSLCIFGESAIDDLIAEIETVLIKRLIKPPFPQTRPLLDTILKKRHRDKLPIFFVLSYKSMPRRLIADLPRIQSLYPFVTFLILSGDDFPIDADFSPQASRLIEPRLEPGAELAALEEAASAISIVNKD